MKQSRSHPLHRRLRGRALLCVGWLDAVIGRIGVFYFCLCAGIENDDADAAMLSGIAVDRTLISVYTVAGLVCGFTAWVAIGRVKSISPIGFETINLDSITAVVIGGTSLFGGRGSIVGSVLGAIIVGVFITGLSLARVDSYWQTFATGCLVIIAVALDQYLRRASK